MDSNNCINGSVISLLIFYCTFKIRSLARERHLPEYAAAGFLASHWSVSPSSGGRHEAVVRARRRAAELKWSAHTERLTPCSSVRLRKRLRAAKAEAAPAEWRAPSMRRLALILLPCAVAVLVHLWLAQRPSSTPPDNNTHSGTSSIFFFLLL